MEVKPRLKYYDHFGQPRRLDYAELLELQREVEAENAAPAPPMVVKSATPAYKTVNPAAAGRHVTVEQLGAVAVGIGKVVKEAIARSPESKRAHTRLDAHREKINEVLGRLDALEAVVGPC